MAFRWRANDGPTLNAGLVVLRISGDPVHYCLEILYFLDFSRGGGGGGSGPSVPPLDPRMEPDNIHLSRYTENQFDHALTAFVRHFAYFLSHAQIFKLTIHSFLNSIRV